jgi:glyoxylase-like metal-dependent hydrolase (beta-lactamase superfamily II)
MKEIVTGIYQLRIPMPNNPLECTNVYLLRGDDGCLMIDTGWNSSKALKSMKEQLNEIGLDFEDISRVIITHTHADHYGLTGRLKEETDLDISVHRLEKEALESRQEDLKEMMQRTEQWFRRHGVPSESFPTHRITPSERRRFRNPTMPDSTLNGDESIPVGDFNLELVWTPGHSPGHICLYERSRKILFSGDHVLPGITPNISLQPQSDGNPLGDFLDSLRNLKQLDVDMVLPAHEHIFTDLQERIDKIILHHHQRYSEIINAMKAGAKTAYQISDGITWLPDFGGVPFEDLTPWVKRMAVSETLAHLRAMEVDDIVEELSDNSVIHYRYTA